MTDWTEIDSAMMSGDFETAQTMLARVPDAPDKIYRMLLLHREYDADTEFRTMLTAALEQYPDFARFHALEALWQHEHGDIPTAIEAYQAALKRDVMQPTVWSNYGLALAALRQHRAAIQAFEKAISIDGQSELAWYNKGMVHKKRHEYEAALQAFTQLVTIAAHPEGALELLSELHFLLGQIDAGTLMLQKRAELCADEAERHHILNSLDLARQAAKREQASGDWKKGDEKRRQGIVAQRILETVDIVQRNPDSNPTKQHLLNGVHGRTTPQPPDGYVESLFDHYAQTYEGHLSNVLGYQAPLLLSQLAQKFNIFSKVTLDLGCGTGLCGPYFQTDELIGVDISAEMLKIADRKNCYTQLFRQDIIEYLTACTLQFELIVAADVLVYMGELDKVFALCSDILRPDASLLLTTELSHSDGYRLSYTGRYQHSSDYVIACAKNAGLSIIEAHSVPLRQEEGEWLTGQIWAFKRVIT